MRTDELAWLGIRRMRLTTWPPGAYVMLTDDPGIVVLFDRATQHALGCPTPQAMPGLMLDGDKYEPYLGPRDPNDTGPPDRPDAARFIRKPKVHFDFLDDDEY